MSEYYVYVYLDQRKPGKWFYENITFLYQPFYIGRGKNYRITERFYSCRLKNNHIKTNKIKKIFKETNELPIHYRLYTNLSFEESKIKETNLIKFFGRIDNGTGILANHTDGGEGGINRIVSESVRKKISIASQKRKRTNKYKCVNKTRRGHFELHFYGNGKSVNRTFDSEIEAAEAYDKISLYIHGSDCDLNFPEKKDIYLSLDLKTFYLNLLNTHKHSNRTYGVSFSKQAKKWRVCFSYRRNGDKKNIYLGGFLEKKEALKMMDRAIIHFNLERKTHFPKENYRQEDINKIISITLENKQKHQTK